MSNPHSPMIQLAQRGRGQHYNPQGEVVHIKDVVSGKACDCFCLECRAQLVARKGSVKEWSFAHLPQAYANGGPGGAGGCSASGETLLHRMAKQVLADEKKILLKGIRVLSRLTREFNGEFIHHELPGFVRFSRKFQTFDQVVLEQTHRLDDGTTIRPDATLYSNGKIFCLVELCVTNPVSDDKKSKIERLGLPCLEIDLSRGVPGFFINENGEEKFRDGWSIDEIREAVTNSKELQNWVFHPEKEVVFERTREENRQIIDAQLEKMRREWQREQRIIHRREAAYLAGGNFHAIQTFVHKIDQNKINARSMDPGWTKKAIQNLYTQRGTITLSVSPGTLKFSKATEDGDFDFLFDPKVPREYVDKVLRLWARNGIQAETQDDSSGVLGRLPFDDHVRACHLLVEARRPKLGKIYIEEMKQLVLDFDSRYVVHRSPAPIVVPPTDCRPTKGPQPR